MTFLEYVDLAKRTRKDMGSLQMDTVHMVLGVSGEIMGEFIDQLKKHFIYGKELDTVNLQEELSDAMWYVANMYDILDLELLNDISFPKISSMGGDNSKLIPSIKMTRQINDTFYYMCSHIMDDQDSYNEDQKPAYLEKIISIIITMTSLANMWGIDLCKGLINNIEKLRVRYPEKYTDEGAIIRNLQEERNKLEK